MQEIIYKCRKGCHVTNKDIFRCPVCQQQMLKHKVADTAEQAQANRDETRDEIIQEQQSRL